jgi:hypothetical protein
MRLGTITIAVLLFGAASVVGAAQQDHATATGERKPDAKADLQSRATAQASALTSNPTGVQVIGTISAKVIESGGRVSGSLTIANRSASDIRDVEVSARTPKGFTFVGGRLDTDGEGEDQCTPGFFGIPPTPAVRCLIPGIVRAGEERAVTIEWRAGGAEAEQSVDATVQWLQVGGQPPSKSYRDLSLGEISSRSSWEFLFTKFPALLPLATGLLGGLIVAAVQWGLAFTSKSAEDARANQAKIEEEKRSSKTRALEATREHTATTWEKMLPISHELATQHYVHIQSFVRSAVRQMESHDKESGGGTKETAESRESFERAFLSLSLFDRRMGYVTEKIGGAYFKNRMGEEIVGWSYFMYSHLYWDKNLSARRDYSAFIAAIHPSAVVSELHELVILAETGAKLGPAQSRKPRTSAGDDATRAGAAHVVVTEDTVAVCARVKKRFHDWIMSGESTEALPYLHAIRDVITFEMNRPYRYWYGGPAEKLSVSKIGRDAILSLGTGFMTGKDLKDFETKIRCYLDESEAGSYEC